MINKSSLWFLTISAIVLVLSIYYIGKPFDKTDMVFSEATNGNETIVIEESEVLTAMKVTQEEEHLEEMQVLQEVLLNTSSTIDQKNEAYEQIKLLNNKKSLEERLEELIDKEFSLSSFVDIDDSSLKVVIANKKDSYELANKVISFVNSNTPEDYYVTVKFE